MATPHSQWPHSGSEMARLIYTRDWSDTALGARNNWSQELRTALDICLASDAPVGLCWGEDLLLLYNDAWTIIGDNRSSSLGKPAREIFEGDWKTVSPYIDEVLSSGEVRKMKNPNLSLFGTEEGMDITFCPILDNSGTVHGIIIMMPHNSRQVTEQLRWERRLVESQTRYRTLVNHFPKGAVGLFDRDLRYTAVGGALLGEVGVKPEDRVGKKIYDIYPEEVVKRVKPYFEKVFQGETTSFEIDFHGRHLFAQTLPIVEDNGEILSGMLVVQDITERWQTRQELRESEAKFRMLTENLNEIIWMLSPETEEFLYINPAFGTIWGISREKLYKETLSFLDFIHPDDREHFHERFVNSTNQLNDEFRIVRPDGQLRWLHVRSKEVYDETGKISRIIGITEDITRRKQAQQELKAINETLEERIKERTQKLRSYQEQLRFQASQLNKAEERERQRLAAELHDKLGQMLALAKMKVEGVRRGGSTASDVEELKQVVDDALSYSQNLMVELKPPPVLDREDVTKVLHWTVHNMEKLGMEITVEDDHRTKPVEKEVRTVLHQSVRELLKNVRKHAGTHKARLEISRGKVEVKITVEDNGRGFDINEKRIAPSEGGGFGLFNIEERIDWHGGKFRIHSEPQKGTTVTLTVPLKDQERPAEITLQDPEEIYVPPQKKEPPLKPSEKIEILLVDDHEMVRNGLRELIEKQDDMVIAGEASQGQEAIELARVTDPDLIVMDVNMPVLNGIEATQKIKQEMPGIQIIGLSLHESQEVMDNMKNAGASAYITKNEAFESLIRTIRAEYSGRGN